MAFQSMAISDTSSLKARHRAARAAFRREIAEQLRALGGDLTDSGEHLALELPGGEGLRVVVGFNEDAAGREGWSEWLQLRIETPDWAEARLTLGWTQADDDASRLALYEKLTDASLPPGKRGLSAEANVREGDYARADAVRALRDELAGMGRGPVLSLAVMPVPALRVPAATARPVVSPAVVDAEFTPVEAPEAVEARLGAVLEAMPDDVRQEALRQFLSYLASHAGGGGLMAEDVQALVADGMRDLRDYYDVYLNGQSSLTGLMARGRGMLLIGALAVAFGGEVMVSGFAFGEMIRANILNWPLAFTSSVLFGGGLLALAKTDKQREFWGRVGLGFALTVSGMSITNRALVDPLQDKIGVVVQDNADLRNHAAALQAEFVDLEKKLAGKNLAAAQAQAGYLAAKRDRPAVMQGSGKAAEAAEAERDAARRSAFTAQQKWDAAKKSDPSRYAAMAMVFVLSGTITGAGQWFIGNYLNSRLGVHEEALKGARARRRMRRSAQRLTGRAAQTDRAQTLMALMRAEYWRHLEQSGRLSRDAVRARVEKAFGKTETELQAIVSEAVRRFRGEWNWGGWFQGRRAPPGAAIG